MAEDGEIRALAQTWEAIASLEPPARRRVLHYLQERCAEAEAAEARREDPRPGGEGADGGGLREDWLRQFRRRLEEYRIRSASERVLVVAAALQEHRGGRAPLRAADMHRVLKRAEAGVENIASLLRAMASGRDKRIRRVRTGGSRLGYEVTDAGLEAARRLMAD